MKDYLKLGTIIDTFSLDGTVKILSSTNNQDIRYKKGNKIIIIDKDKNEKELTVASYRQMNNVDVVRFEEINNVDEAALLKGNELYIKKDYKDLKEGYFFYSDLIGCSIMNEEKEIGKVITIEEFPAQLTLRAKTKEGKSFFIPFIEQFILKVDIENKKIYINYMEGML